MSQPTLSILIPYTVERIIDYNKLLTEFKRQIDEGLYNAEIEILSDDTDKHMTIGEKRNILYQRANGLYSVQWDSDDGIHQDGIKLILQSINQNPGIDCVTYKEYVNIDGKEYKSNHSIIYDDWDGDGSKLFPEGVHFRRTPFMKSTIRTDIAKSVQVPHLRFGEDHEWSKLLKKVLQSEAHIPEEIYRYIHVSSDPTERYGLNK